MKVEAYLRSKVTGYPWDKDTLEAACISPLFAKPSKLEPIDLNDEIEAIADDEAKTKSLKYAVSTLYYAVSGVFSGGSRSEQVGDVKTSVSGYEVTQADREYYRNLADSLRDEIECETEEDVDEGGLFDASTLRKPQARKGYGVH
jgi:hypothetical protein